MIAELEKIQAGWKEVKDYLSIPHSKKEYNKLVSLLDLVIDEVGNKQNHPLAGLLEMLGSLVEAYEEENFKPIDAKPIEVLKYLMQEHNLSQKDMKQLGSQGVVSEILNGKRELNVRQIKELSKRFGVSPAVFI
ncbi:MAG TPA: helix-turn-helix domain-containing protein [Leptospiraceae bacterium]|nr:helix-turn-helix domain-containing protein [Leptospiraceae bacterium]HMW06393.1 helix-turn-helix domain-containing protein [Leptospiraceae bacterium]HMX31695.1 helix-turn-helix domain-containing protein [Leptospiraceae bacterium]HMY31981.1 helix-turn-helix domain-containing protein [Leptospiraceae bacterium]HMZ63155.1 helix-turn-helix domain-containing protein [Leptospiraceae bacterium]